MSLFMLGSYNAPIGLWKLLSNGKFEFVKLVPTSENKGTTSPSWISQSACGKYVYCTNEGEDSISSYQYVHSNGAFDLKLLTTIPTGQWPCHLETTSSYVLVANYGSGTLVLHSVGDRGEILPASQVLNHNTHGDETKVSHVHQVISSHPEYPNIFHVCDLGLDSIFTYRLTQSIGSIDEESVGTLTLVDTFTLPDGSGPRHLVMHPNGSYAYVVNELSNTVCVLAVNKEIRLLSTEEANQSDNILIQSCLPSGSTAAPGTMGAAEILLSKNSNFLYITNRCIDTTADTDSVLNRSTVTVFAVTPDGAAVHQIQSVCTQGIHPRHMCLTSNDTRLCVANKVSSNLVTFSVDSDSGLIDETSAVVTDCREYCPDPNFLLEIKPGFVISGSKSVAM